MTARTLAPVVLALAALPARADDPKPPRPNFVLINVDDLGYADVGPFGSKINRTPHLDRMTRERGFLADPNVSPVAVWLQHPARAADYRAIGIDLYVGLWRGRPRRSWPN